MSSSVLALGRKALPTPPRWARGQPPGPFQELSRRSPSPNLSSSSRSYSESPGPDGAGWVPRPQPGLNVQTFELAAQNNHYCHAQKGPGGHCDPRNVRARRQLYVASAICLLFMTGEIIGKELSTPQTMVGWFPLPQVFLLYIPSLEFSESPIHGTFAALSVLAIIWSPGSQ